LVVDTSTLQYLHQLGLLHILSHLGDRVVVPLAVVAELKVGLKQGIDLPRVSEMAWVHVSSPVPDDQPLSFVAELGAGEIAVLQVAHQRPDSVAILDDRLARRIARLWNVKFTGTLGLLCDAKRAGLISEVRPLLDQLVVLGFRLAPAACQAVLRLADEGT